jgi:diadenosine tetraphosphate (Ap4A) HIT family hydrolase
MNNEGPVAESGWSLHPQLQADAVPVGDLSLSRLLAINDADYPWLILVPRRAGTVEIADLGEEAAALMAEIVLVSRAIVEITRCDKLNVAAIGNVVPQLHVHIVARRKGDPLWPKPIWGAAPPRPGDAAAFQKFIGSVRGGLSI